MSHDQLSKSLIVTFFDDFLRLTVPDAAPLLRPGEATFVDKEIFTDWPAGERRELDLLAQVPVEEGTVPVMVHVEIESRARSGMDERLWHYYMQIRLRHRRLVLPILVNLRGGRPGVGVEVLEEGIIRTASVTFPYHVLSLSGCRAEDWLTRPEPVAWAFAALMRPGHWSRAQLKLECLRRIARSEVTGKEKEILVNWLQTCVKLSGRGAAEYQRLLELEENKEIREMDTSWLGRAEARGVQKAVVRMRQAVLLGLERRFGTVPPRVRRRLEAIHSIERLAEMVERLPLVENAGDLLTPDRAARAAS
jgi:hypothetical protein